MIQVNRKAFSITELLIAITIMGVMAGAITLAPDVGRQTAKREAERIAAYLINLTHKFSSKRESFEINFYDKNPQSKFEIYRTDQQVKNALLDTFKLRGGCTSKLHAKEHTFTYTFENNSFNRQGGTLTIEDSETRKYYVIISPIGGRIRASEKPPSNWENPE